MELDVSALQEHRILHLEVPIALTLETAESDGDTAAFPEPFTGEALAFRTEDGIVIRFQVSGVADLQCSRCLTVFRHPLKLDFTEEFRASKGAKVPGDLQDDDETGAVFVPYQGDKIEVAEVLRQHILLALPVKPLCKDDCLGLCPTCGRNRNEGACDCADPERGDARFGVLKQLLDRPGSDPQ